MKLLLIDGNYFLHRAFNIVVKTRDPAYLEKNVLTLLASMVVSETVLHRATHVAITFDSKKCWRLDVYPKYKANRRKAKDPIMVTHPKYDAPVQIDATPGSFVKSAKAMLRNAGFAVFQKNGLESDDLLGSLTHMFSEEVNIVIDTRDKDMAGLVSKNVALYWPVEKKLLGPSSVKEHYGVMPFQIRDFLSLTGDAVDNIPGVPGVAAKTAASILQDDTLKNRLKTDAKVRAKLKPYISRIAIAQKLTTLKKVDLACKLKDLVPTPPDKDALYKCLWQVPKNIDAIRDVSHAAKYKGLFKR